MANGSLSLNYLSNTVGENVKKILQLLEKGNQLVSHTQYGDGLQEVTLILGNTGAGKSTFTRWFSDNDDNFVSKEDEQTPGEFVIIDPTNNSTINTATTVSTTVFPELLVNKKTNAYYYDFPGFGDTRGAAHDIAVAYFIKKAIDNSKRIKLVFVVKYESVTGKAVRDDFTGLVRHVTKFVPNIGKFKDGIALVVTRVRSNIPGEKVVKGIAVFITKAKEWLEEQERTEHVDHTTEKKLMDIFLSKEGGENYSRIGIFAAPDRGGSLRSIPSMQENKKNIATTLGKLRFIERNDSDFGYTVPKQSLVDVDGIVKEINKGITDGIADTGKEVQKYVLSREEQLCDVFELYNETNVAYNKLLKIKEEANEQPDPRKCVQRLRSIVELVPSKSDASRQTLTKAENNGLFSSFLQIVSGSSTAKDSFKCAEGLNEAVEYCDRSKKWFQLLINLYDDLSELQAQRNRAGGPCIYLIKTIIENAQNEKHANILDSFLRECLPSKKYNLNELSSITLNNPEFGALARVLKLTLDYELLKSCSNGKLTIKGPYINFGDIQNALRYTCHEPPKSIEIFALIKVFADIDLDLTGRGIHLSVLSPIWDVRGSRRIILDGAEGKAHNSHRASNGRASGENGQNGAPGLPGGHGGSFFGIGQTFVSFSDLAVSANGGKGGPGQDGGDGIAGDSGRDAYNDLYRKSGNYYSKNHQILKENVENYFIGADESVYVLGGKPGSGGGSGGDGGRGGMGGYPGDVTMISASPSTGGFDLIAEKRAGCSGSNGVGGQGALGGMPGRDLKVYLDHNKLAFLGIGHDDVQETRLDFNSVGRAASGRNGGTGGNSESMMEATQYNPLPNRRDIVNSYVAYLEANLNCNSVVKQTQLREFLNNIKNSEVVRSRVRKRRSIYESRPTQDGVITSRKSTKQKPISHYDDVDIKPAHLSADDANNSASSSAYRSDSPLNTAVNLATNFFGRLASLNVANAINYQLVKGGIESMFGGWKQSNVRITTTTTTNTNTNTKDYANHAPNVNETLALADFAVRCVTKVKPYNGEERPTDFSEARAFALRIVEKFEKISRNLSTQYDVPAESLDFDPVILMSKVEKEIIDQNYTKIGQLLINFMAKNYSRLNHARIHNFVRGEIDEMIREQNKADSNYHHQVEDEDNLIIVQNGFCRRICYRTEVNYLEGSE